MTPNTQPASLSMDELMAQFGNKFMPVTPKRGALIQGTVVRIDAKHGAWIDFGGKTDALVPSDEIGNLSEGQTTVFFVSYTPEDGEFDGGSKQWGGPVFSANRAKAWTEVQNSLEQRASVTVKVGDVKRYNRGDQAGSIAGVNVFFNGLKGFVPYSLLGVGGRGVEALVGQDIEVKVAEVSVENRKLVFNHREVVAEQQLAIQARRDELFSSLKPGDVRDGKVVRIVEYGCFVDVGEGLHGLVHRSELSNDSKAPVASLIKVGDAVPVKVLKAETVENKRQLALSVKQVRQATFLNDVKVGDIIDGTVSRLTAFGAFVELSSEHGVDGLIHKSQFSSAVRNGRKTLVAGETLRVKVIEVNTETGRVSLSLKEVAQPRTSDSDSESVPAADETPNA
jgi:small subunit ribosomal protein S1